MRYLKLPFFALLFFLYLSAFTVQAHERNIYFPKCPKKNFFFHSAARFIGEVIIDALMLNVHVFSMNTVKIMTGFTPFYLGARMIDEDLQLNFYDAREHKNVNQLPNCCYEMAKCGVAVPIILLSSLTVLGWNEDLRTTARLFLIGLPFVQSGKDIIKQLRFKACLRPWNERFSKKERSPGGFPSGHMANVVFMTALFGMRHGPVWAIPLGLVGTFVLVDFINCNRHYLSQLVAGGCLGLIFAFAANTVIEKKLEARRYSFDCVQNNQGEPAFKMSYHF